MSTNRPRECVSCLDEFAPKEMVKVPCHHYCKECFTRLIASSVQHEQHFPPKCCLNEIPVRTILKYINDELKVTFRERDEEWRIPVSDRIYCSQPDCSLWLKPDQVNGARRIGRCTQGHWSCTICRGPEHAGDECPQDREMALTNELAEEEGWKRCFSCHALVEHREACQHMTCRCGSEFCYVCGLRWRTCACTMEQLAALKLAADHRREARIQKEAEDEEELREALRQIEEFEREEALKAVLIREEMERLEEERRQRELEERIRQESIRRKEVEMKYIELRDILDQLHDLQQVLVEYQHDKDDESLSSEAVSAKQTLQVKQAAQVTGLNAACAANIAEREAEYAKEYAARVAGEKRLEGDYLQQLREFYDGKQDGEARVEAAMGELRRKMDKGFRSWEKHRDEQLAAYRDKVEEEQTIKEELMYSVKVRLEDAYVDKEVELQRRKQAEMKWVARVMVERERLLLEMEAEELDDGETASCFSLESDAADHGGSEDTVATENST
jgi:hypothetical protein